MRSEIRRRAEKRSLHRDLIELIIYFTEKNQSLIPADKKQLLSKIIVAACDYISEGKEVCDHYGNDDSWHEKIMLRFPEIVDEFGENLHPELKEMLINISHFRRRFVDYGFDYGNIFYDLFKLYTEGKPFMILPESFNLRIEKEVLTSFDLKLIQQCKDISKIMVEYIKEDIKKHKTPVK